MPSISATTLPFKNVVQLAYHHVGPKLLDNMSPAIIDLHGVFGAKSHFKPLAKKLAADLEVDVYSLDLRNHGDSPMARPYDYITLSNDVVHFIESMLGPKRPVQLIGFSLGGKVGLATTLSKNCNVTSCVSIDIPPYYMAELDSFLLENYATILNILQGKEGYRILKGEPSWKTKVLDLFKAVPVNLNDGVVRYFAAGFLMNAANHESKDEFLEYKQPLLNMPDLLDCIKAWPTRESFEAHSYNYKTNTPVLFCKSLQSPFIKPDYSLLGEQFPNYKVKEFNTTHNIAHEAPELFYKTITQFFKQNQ